MHENEKRITAFEAWFEANERLLWLLEHGQHLGLSDRIADAENDVQRAQEKFAAIVADEIA